MSKLRGFEVVTESNRKNHKAFTDEKGRKFEFPLDVKLPTRADKNSAGNDLYAPKDVQLFPNKPTLIWTDVKAYMQPDEMLDIYIRSSLAIKHGIKLTNQVGIVDASYYNNEDNEGNIAISLTNTSGKTYEVKEGERIAQGIFVKVLPVDNDNVIGDERIGGIGSSGK